MKKLQIAMILTLIAVFLLGCAAVSAESGFHYWKDPITGVVYFDRDPDQKDFDPDYLMPPNPRPVRFQVSSNGDGTYNLYLRFKNASKWNWTAGRYWLVCTRGANFFENNENAWPIELDVPRGTFLVRNFTLQDFRSGAKLKFSISDGNEVVSSFWIQM